MWYKKILQSLIKSNTDFVEKLKEFLRLKGLSITEFCNIAHIPQSTMYKIMSDPTKDFRVSLLKQIIQTIAKIEGYYSEGITIAVITTRGALNVLKKEIKIGEKKIIIKEYPANTIEEEIIQGIRAQQEGVSGIICGPVAATTIDKVVEIPVVSLNFRESAIQEAIKNVMKKLV